MHVCIAILSDLMPPLPAVVCDMLRMAAFLLLQYPECFAGEVRPIDIGRVKNIAQTIADQTAEFDNTGVEFGANEGAALVVPMEVRQWEAIIQESAECRSMGGPLLPKTHG